jgi:hypothetical protein
MIPSSITSILFQCTRLWAGRSVAGSILHAHSSTDNHRNRHIAEATRYDTRRT